MNILDFLKRDYEEFKVRINGLVAMAQKVPEEGWTMQDGTPWPGNNVRDHPGMIQVFVRDIDFLFGIWSKKQFEYRKAGQQETLTIVNSYLRNYLSSVLIQQLFLTWDHDDLSLRAKAARILIVLLCKHEFDARYQKPEDKLHIAQLYFPLVGQCLLQNHEFVPWQSIF